MDLILRNARRIGAEHELTDIGIAGGHVAAIEPGLAAEGETIDLGGRLVSPGFVETHIHLDKSCILDRCRSERGDLEEAIAEAAKAKAAFTPEDVHSRAVRTLEKAILQGTTHMRTHLEVTPNIAARLQALAEPDSIVIAESTRRLVGDLFEYRDLALRSDRTNRQKGRPPCRLQAARLRTSCHRGLGLRTWGGDCRPSLSTYLRDATGVSPRRWASMLPVPDHPAMIERKRSDGILKPSDALCQHNFLGKDRAVGPPSCATPRS